MIHPAIRDLFLELNRHPGFQQLVRCVTDARAFNEHVTLSLSGLTPTAKAVYLVLLWRAIERPLLLILDGSKQAEVLSELIATFFDLLVSDKSAPRPLMIPALDVMPFRNLSTDIWQCN